MVHGHMVIDLRRHEPLSLPPIQPKEGHKRGVALALRPLISLCPGTRPQTGAETAKI